MEVIVIEVCGLSKKYGRNRGIDNISFSIPEGQIVGFLGPNGAGKTTTMNILTGYLAADSGQVKIAGIDIRENPKEAKRHIGYLPEQPPLNNAMTVRAYLNFVYELKDVKSGDRDAYIAKIAASVGLTDVRGRVIGHLSKGYRQRVGLAQALVGDPAVLILDEPTIGLDPRQIVEIRNVIKKMGKKRTIILSTHILPEVSAICQRVLLISNGAIIADNTPEQLGGAEEKNSALLMRIGGAEDDILLLLRGHEGIKMVEAIGSHEPHSHDFIIECESGVDMRGVLVSALTAAGHAVLMLRPKAPSLEEMFLKLTREEVR